MKRVNLLKKEIIILRTAIETAEKSVGKKTTNSPIVKKIIQIVEYFLKRKRLLVYGGTAINNILPKKAQFYNKNIEIPDYDFFSENALEDAKELANIYYKNGFEEIEAKAGIHFGTYKVFVNFIPVADITQLDVQIFDNLYKNAIVKKQIKYVPADFLRMSLYLELSRPNGDVSRWEKVFKRLVILNEYYPLKAKDCSIDTNSLMLEKNYKFVKNILIDLKVVFFGTYAITLYSDLDKSFGKKHINNDGSFKILSEFPLNTVLDIKKRVEAKGIRNIFFERRDGIGEIIAPYYKLSIDDNIIVYIYRPLACHSYNVIKASGKSIRIATIDTLLSFYLAFLYSGSSEYIVNDILCLASFLFDLQAKNRLEQKGVLKRFSTTCYGEQETLANVRAVKAEKFKELKNKRTSKEYQEYFLRYVPTKKSKTKTKKAKK